VNSSKSYPSISKFPFTQAMILQMSQRYLLEKKKKRLELKTASQQDYLDN